MKVRLRRGGEVEDGEGGGGKEEGEEVGGREERIGGRR